jgi:hypothetical protein
MSLAIALGTGAAFAQADKPLKIGIIGTGTVATPEGTAEVDEDLEDRGDV